MMTPKPVQLYELNDGMSVQDYCKRMIFNDDVIICSNDCTECPYENLIRRAMIAKQKELDDRSLAQCYEEQAGQYEERAAVFKSQILESEVRRQEPKLEGDK